MLATGSITTISGTKGKQFGKDIYTSLIKFRDLDKFLAVFPQVQRKVDRRRVNLLAGYVLKGLEEGNMSFLTSITATCRGDIFYNDTKQVIAIDTSSQLSINDGQHRFEGVRKAISEIKKEIRKTKAGESKEQLKEKMNLLEEMTLPIVIFANISESEEMQLFHDLNNLAKTPSKSVNLRFNQSNLYIRLAKEVSQENEFLSTYGVDMENDKLSDKNQNFALLNTISNSISYLLLGKNKQDDSFLTSDNYQAQKGNVNSMLDNLFTYLPSDITNRKKYLLGRASTLQGICKFIYDAKNKMELSDDLIYKVIEDTEWRHDEVWLNYGGSWDKNNEGITFSGSAAAISSVYKMLMENLEKIN
ncbi:DGQHR domain-containing protein [Peribacillus frigoritolerans]|uniref:DNA sulfur modification protein DndB n=1 Tax=Peribacillus frigoritolerans TaxID=450367 RepID=UPI0021AAB102|nr:DNA sulfur modification protein DndB [Peribacillus frigoritolerans]MCT4479137.1 DGQHR domain-containing protein [Peribacillus frigoritolerans]